MAKAAKQTETPPANHNEPSERDRKVLFFMSRNAYAKALATKKAADAALKNVCKTIKADLGEYGVSQIKAYEQAQTPEGQAKLDAELAAKAQALRFAGKPVNYQVDMFEDLAPLAERAFAMGEEAGLRGDTLSNPYNEGSEEGQRYAAGWHEGQGALAAGIKKLEPEIIKGGADEEPFPEEHQEAAE